MTDSADRKKAIVPPLFQYRNTHCCSLLLLSGIADSVAAGGKKSGAAQATLVFVPCGCTFSVSTEQTLEKYSQIEFALEQLWGTLSDKDIAAFQSALHEPFTIVASPDLLSLYHLTLRAQKSDGDKSFPYLMLALLSRLQQLKAVQSTQQRATTHQENLVEQAQAIIAREYAEKITLSNTARELFVNPSYLSILFKRITGTAFCQYVANYRIERAKSLLSETNELVSDIALSTGFATTAYFVTTFGEHCGMTPTAYRKQNRRPYTPLP